MLTKCEPCDGQGVNCWVLTGVTTSGAFYNHAHFAWVETCPFCGGSGRQALEASDER